MKRAWARTRTLVETMLEVMEKGIRKPDEVAEQWERLFGARSSAVANLEKLVQVLIELHGQIEAESGGEAEAEAPLSHDEVSLLSAWLRENPPAGDQ
ncbi:MAG: hypothetical protein WDN72_04555 [Alphaproteobacteria bacterium]